MIDLVLKEEGLDGAALHVFFLSSSIWQYRWVALQSRELGMYIYITTGWVTFMFAF